MFAALVAQRAEDENLATQRRAQDAERQATRDADLRTLLEEVAEIDVASNAVIDLIDAGRLDDAEHAARELLVRFPKDCEYSPKQTGRLCVTVSASGGGRGGKKPHSSPPQT